MEGATVVRKAALQGADVMENDVEGENQHRGDGIFNPAAATRLLKQARRCLTEAMQHCRLGSAKPVFHIGVRGRATAVDARVFERCAWAPGLANQSREIVQGRWVILADRTPTDTWQ